MKASFNVLLLLCLISCSSKNETDHNKRQQAVEHELRELTRRITEAEVRDDLPAFLQYYDDHALSMPEYQLTLEGRSEIESFYAEIFKRQKIRSFHRQSHEFIHLGKSIVEIGTFNKEYTGPDSDSLSTLSGKYWNVWTTQSDGNFKLTGESFGYFHRVTRPETLVIWGGNEQSNDSDITSNKDIPFELKAYNALMEKGVRTRDGNLRADFFTKDGTFFPFADTAVTGIDKIRPYLVAYSSGGTASIDSIMCYTYAFESTNEYVLEYDMFKVTWSLPNTRGRTEGKGIRIWKRQPDLSLRLYREIGTHNL